MPQLHEIVQLIKKSFNLKEAPSSRNISGLDGIAKVVFISALLDERQNSNLIICKNSDESEKIASGLKLFCPKKKDVIYEYDFDDTNKRISALNGLAFFENAIVVAPLRSISKNIPQRKNFIANTIHFYLGMRVEINETVRRLVDIGYVRVPMVENPGELSLRGGILDIFSVSKNPLRVEFGPDGIDSLREFDVLTQRSTIKIRAADALSIFYSGNSDIFDYLNEEDGIYFDNPREFEMPLKIKNKSSVIELDPFRYSAPTFFVESLLAPFFGGNMEGFVSHCSELKMNCFIVSKQAMRISELFLENSVNNPLIKIISGEISEGFIMPAANLCIFSDSEIFGEHVPRRRFEVSKQDLQVRKLYADFKEGDYIVHKNYGIGIYKGIVLEKVNDAASDYILIQYAGADKLYIPVNQMHLISKYSAPGDFNPKLNRLGTNEWLYSKKRARNSIKKIAENLREIYSARKNKIGIAYPIDSQWQIEFEKAFPYEETPGQADAVKAVKTDMESLKPMDRIICGDVGYGKTEVALRCVFKAVSSGYQAAVLAPTTILAEQHYKTFLQRFAPFPFTVKMLSRFVSHEEQKQIIKLIESGGIDVVIGTHRLIQKDLKFKNLGLLVIDEEQKFGVSHKERIKNLKRNIDVLTLTATPIPRTLYMSLSGIWDMSMISTPPAGRTKVETFVSAWSPALIKQAVDREIDRGGQIFYVHNRVETIYGITEKIQKLFPKLKIAAAHGQLNEHILEKIMTDFVDRKYDLLVCSAIIESGLDIPNVNTIIVEQPHRFGLSTLYQLRGRVGRSTVKAYAYFLYDKKDILSEKSQERLRAINSFTELGSGYKIAMRDLEIRGAGDVLGAYQHGHMVNIGFDLYCEMLEEAAQEIKGIKPSQPSETLIDLAISAFIPKDYINDDSERIAIYKRLNVISSNNDLIDIKKELIDRFGPIPIEPDHLFMSLELKIKAEKKGIKSIIQKENFVIIERFGKKIKMESKGTTQELIIKKIDEVLNSIE